MKSILLLSAAFLGAGIGTALAADVTSSDTPAWSGFHGTLLGGYSQITADGSQQSFFGPEYDASTSGGMAVGVGLGYQHAMGDVVLGVDGDISVLTNTDQLAMKDTVEADYDWFATARASAGFDLDGTLIYGTGGLAVLGADFTGDGDTQ